MKYNFCVAMSLHFRPMCIYCITYMYLQLVKRAKLECYGFIFSTLSQDKLHDTVCVLRLNVFHVHIYRHLLFSSTAFPVATCQYTWTHIMDLFYMFVRCALICLTDINSFVPGRGAKYCDEYVCLFVCHSVHSHNSKIRTAELHQIFVHVACGRVLVGPPLTALQFVIYFRFYG